MKKNYAIVTGGSKGLGHAIVQNLLSNGEHVISIARSHKTNLHQDSNLITISADISDANVRLELFDTLKTLNIGQVSFINNAAMCLPSHPKKLSALPRFWLELNYA